MSEQEAGYQLSIPKLKIHTWNTTTRQILAEDCQNDQNQVIQIDFTRRYCTFMLPLPLPFPPSCTASKKNVSNFQLSFDGRHSDIWEWCPSEADESISQPKLAFPTVIYTFVMIETPSVL